MDIRNALQLYDEVIREIPDIQSVLSAVGPLPPEALFMGIAEDGLPILLNMDDPLPTSILAQSTDKQSMETFLKCIGTGIHLRHLPKIEFGVVTSHPDRWQSIESLSGCVGIFADYSSRMDDFILSLASWAYGSIRSRNYFVLLLDDLSSMFLDMEFDTQQNLRWLLLKGASRKVWTIATSSEKMEENLFGTHIIGTSVNQFQMKEDTKQVRFWIPKI